MDIITTTDTFIEGKEIISPKDSTILFLMNLARVYSCNNDKSIRYEYVFN
ncbi:MAG: hypothetical protein IKK64_03705 [Bacteroidales bacterium]|nr:hypothetical protein [Bacteroidales bacterium]